MTPVVRTQPDLSCSYNCLYIHIHWNIYFYMHMRRDGPHTHTFHIWVSNIPVCMQRSWVIFISCTGQEILLWTRTLIWLQVLLEEVCIELDACSKVRSVSQVCIQEFILILSTVFQLVAVTGFALIKPRDTIFFFKCGQFLSSMWSKIQNLGSKGMFSVMMVDRFKHKPNFLPKVWGIAVSYENRTLFLYYSANTFHSYTNS